MLRICSHFLCHVRIANRGLGCLHVLRSSGKVAAGIAETVLQCPDLNRLIGRLDKGILEHIDRRICSFPRGHLDLWSCSDHIDPVAGGMDNGGAVPPLSIGGLQSECR